MALVGRQKERAKLRDLCGSDEAEFLAVYGRRRVGKTFLIRELFKDQICFRLTGTQDGTTEEQLQNFALELGKTHGTPLPPKPPESWQEAFHQLEDAIGSIPPRKGKRRVIFFDELPWLATHRSRFLGSLGYFWNTWASLHPDILLIVCGSAASWMIQKLLNDRGGLHNRVTLRMRIEPFCLAECEEYLQEQKVKLNREQIVEIVSVTGGIPFYLKAVKRGRSSVQAIGEICFEKDGLLRDEFDRLFPALFAHHEHHTEVIRALAKKRIGLTRKEVVKNTNLPSGGSLTRILNELEESGFIESTTTFGKGVKDRCYRLIDEYLLFYLRWIEPRKNKVTDWKTLQDTPAWRAWSGYAFESLCHRHLPQIKSALGIAAVYTETTTWSTPPDNDGNPGAQIDLLIDRRDDCIHLCEIKFSRSEFVVDKKYAATLNTKREVFRQATKTKKALILTMITTHGVRKNAYGLDVTDASVELDALFEKVE